MNAPEKVINGVKTRTLHGKDYVEVKEKVRLAHEKGAFDILAVEHFNIEERWFVRAIVSTCEHQYIGTAEVKFTAPKNTPDGASPFECAETSAVGRALAFAGIGNVDSIASFDEVVRVIEEKQEKPQVIQGVRQLPPRPQVAQVQ